MMVVEVGNWVSVRDGDARAIAIYRRHYSARLSSKHHSGIGGPGSRLILLSPKADALFVWRYQPDGLMYSARIGGQRGIMCSVFRNEGPLQSSDLIREAEAIAWGKWPNERLFTFVDGGKIASVNPGYCFKQAGWTKCGESKGGLVILEKLP